MIVFHTQLNCDIELLFVLYFKGIPLNNILKHWFLIHSVKASFVTVFLSPPFKISERNFHCKIFLFYGPLTWYFQELWSQKTFIFAFVSKTILFWKDKHTFCWWFPFFLILIRIFLCYFYLAPPITFIAVYKYWCRTLLRSE